MMYEELKLDLQGRHDGGMNAHGYDLVLHIKALKAIEQLERQLADRDAEIAKLIEAVADHVTARAEQYAELNKYRDAPVVASASVSNRTSIYGPTINFDYGEALRMAVPPSGKPLALIGKPGEQ